MTAVYVEVGDVGYDVEVAHFSPGSRDEGWEVALGDRVVEHPDWHDQSRSRRVTLAHFLAQFAAWAGVTTEEADRIVCDMVGQELTQRLEDRWEDRACERYD